MCDGKDGEDGKGIKKVFFHFRGTDRRVEVGAGKPPKLLAKGGVTVLVEIEDRGPDQPARAVATASVCSPEENYRKKKGITAASGRMAGFRKKYDEGQVSGNAIMAKNAVAVVATLSLCTPLQLAESAANLNIASMVNKGLPGAAEKIARLHTCVAETVEKLEARR